MESNETSGEVAAATINNLSAMIYHLHEHHRHYHFDNTTANVFNTSMFSLLEAVICKSNKTSIEKERDASILVFSLFSLLSILFMLIIIIYYYTKRYCRSCRSALNDCIS